MRGNSGGGCGRRCDPSCLRQVPGCDGRKGHRPCAGQSGRRPRSRGDVATAGSLTGYPCLAAVVGSRRLANGCRRQRHGAVIARSPAAEQQRDHGSPRSKTDCREPTLPAHVPNHHASTQSREMQRATRNEPRPTRRISRGPSGRSRRRSTSRTDRGSLRTFAYSRRNRSGRSSPGVGPARPTSRGPPACRIRDPGS